MAVLSRVTLCGLLFAAAVASRPCRAAGAGIPDVPTNLTDRPGMVRKAEKPPRVARVRIPVRLTPYEGVLVHTREGRSRIDYRALTPMTHTLRSRIERVNHFYVRNWHIETVPEAFDKDTLRYTVRMRFFKRYGEGGELEEQVGTSVLAGVLRHEADMVFLLEGKGEGRFNDRNGNPVLAVDLGGAKPGPQNLSSGEPAPGAAGAKPTVIAKPEAPAAKALR